MRRAFPSSSVLECRLRRYDQMDLDPCDLLVKPSMSILAMIENFNDKHGAHILQSIKKLDHHSSPARNM